MRTGLLLLAATISGCATLGVVRGVTELPQLVTVELVEHDSEMFTVNVSNCSQLPIVVNRDAIKMATPAGVRRRIPGGATSVYVIPPGAEHIVRVRFVGGGLQKGQQVELQLGDAIFATDGTQLHVPSLVLVQN
jgi:hypothetical protein